MASKYRLRSVNNMVRRYKRSGTTYKDTLEKSGFTGLDNYIKAFVDTAADGMADKAMQWAAETLEDFKGNVPVDTGNLRDSLDIKVADNGVSVGVNVDKLIGPKRLRSTKTDAPRLTAKNFASMKREILANAKTLKQARGRISVLEHTSARYRVGQMRYIPPYNYVPFAEKTRQIGMSGAILTNFTKKIWRELARANAREIFK